MHGPCTLTLSASSRRSYLLILVLSITAGRRIVRTCIQKYKRMPVIPSMGERGLCMMPLPAWLPVWSLVPPGGVSVPSPMFLPRESLSNGVSIQGVSVKGVSVQGSLSRGVRVYVQGDFCGKTPLKIGKADGRILLECYSYICSQTPTHSTYVC